MSGIQIMYSELFSISLQQRFYHNGFCPSFKDQPEPDFELVPTTETLALMEKLDLIYRRKDMIAGGLVLARVHGQTGGGNELLRFKPGVDDKLCFHLVLRNMALLGFTNLAPTPNLATVYYFTNNQTDIFATRDNLHLTQDAAGVKTENDTLLQSSNIYRFHSPVVVAPGTAMVRHKLTAMQLAPDSLVTNGGQSDLVFNLASLPSGICELLISNAVKQTFYFDGNVAIMPFGVIEILLSTILPENYRVVEPDFSLTDARPQYKIKFTNRQTHWRYTFRLPATAPLAREIAALNDADRTAFLNNLKLTASDASVTFSQSSFDERGIVFESDNVLALQEKYYHISGSDTVPLLLTLKKNNGILKDNLPYPVAGDINASALPTVYSDIFITL
jgi:hypothetical protein